MRHQIHDRRLVLRLAVLGEVRAFLDGASVYVLDLSTGGFAVQARTPFVVGTTYRFVLCSPRRSDLVVQGVAMHCLQTTEINESWYVAGFAFVPDTTEAVRAHIAALIEDVVDAARLQRQRQVTAAVHA